jgi:hypothetical protein
MPLPGVNIQVQRNGLGLREQSADGVVGLIANGVAATGLALGVATQIFSLAQAIALGITAAYDTTNNVRVYRDIKEFYDEAGEGSELWIMLVSQAVTQTLIVTNTEQHARKLLNDAAGRIRILGISRNPAVGYTPVVTSGIDQDVVTAMAAAKVLGTAFEALYRPVRIVLDGYAYNGNTAQLVDLKIQDTNRVAVFIGNSESRAKNGVGLLLGRLAKDPVQRNPGRVKSGAIAGVTAAFIGTATLAAVEATIQAIDTKGFITLRRHEDKAGFFFTDAPTATADNDDYSTLPNGRVIDKGIRLTYKTYVEEILDEIEIDTTTGYIAPDKAKYYQSIIERAIETNMAGEISGVRAYVNPAQNVLSTKNLDALLEITPVGYARTLTIKIGLRNPFNA